MSSLLPNHEEDLGHGISSQGRNSRNLPKYGTAKTTLTIDPVTHCAKFEVEVGLKLDEILNCAL
jgi:hypothetical protein